MRLRLPRREERRHGRLEPLHDDGPDTILGTETSELLVHVGLLTQGVDGDGTRLGVRQPVLRHAGLFVGPELDVLIEAARAGREDLGDEVRDAM